MKANWTFKINLIIHVILNIIMGLTSKFVKHSYQLFPNVTKMELFAVLKDRKKIPWRHLILTASKSRKSGQIFCAKVDIPCYYNACINYFWVGIIAVYYKHKKRSAKIYRVARNRSKTVETPGYNAVSVYTGDRDDIYMEENNSTQHEQDSVVLIGVKWKQDYEVEARWAFPFLRFSVLFLIETLSNCCATILLIKTLHIDIASRLFWRTVVKMWIPIVKIETLVQERQHFHTCLNSPYTQFHL